jgi:hypothetical protein
MFEKGKGQYYKYWLITDPGRKKMTIVHGGDNKPQALQYAKTVSDRRGVTVTVVEVLGTYHTEL